MPPDYLPVIQQAIEKLSIVAMLSWGVVAFARGWVVPASVHAALTADRDQWIGRHDKLYAVAEMTLRAKVGGGS